MKNNYPRLLLGLLTWLSLFTTSALRAQTPPTIQWQKLMGGPIKQAANGDIILGSGSTVSRLNQSTGTVIWQTALPHVGISGPTTVQDLILANDGSIITLTKDRIKWSLTRLDASGSIQWSKPFVDATQSNDLLRRNLVNVVQGNDGSYVAMGYQSYPRAGSFTEMYRLSSDGSLLTAKGISYAYPNAIRPNSVGSKVIATADGGYLVVGTTDDGAGAASLGWAAKLDGALNVVWQNKYEKTIHFDDVVQATDGQHYLVTGKTNYVLGSFAGIRAIDTSGQLVEQPRSDTQTGDTYFFIGDASIAVQPGSTQPRSVLLTTSYLSNSGRDIRLSTPGLTLSLGGSGDERASSFIPTADGGYLISGTTTSTDGDVQGKTDNTVSGWLVKLAPIKPLALNAPVYDCSTGAITLSTSGGDGTPITFVAPGVTRISPASPSGIVEQGLRNDPKPILFFALQNGQEASYEFDLKAACSGTTPTNPTPPPTTGGTLTLGQPTYDCTTGAITFNTSGGNGTLITYTAPGITRSSATSNTGTVEAGLRNDPKVITITANQSGQTATYNFDLKAACSGTTPTNPTPPPTTGSTLTLTQPAYVCATGAFTFYTNGGDGTLIEFQAAGITGWTTNPNQFVDKDSRTANDVKPFTLMARQSGQVVTYTWDLKAVCGRSARLATNEAGAGLQLRLLGNPVTDQVSVEIDGHQGQPVRLQLLRSGGQLLDERQLTPTDAAQPQVFQVGQQPSGLLLLRATSGTQQQTIKVLKQ